MWALLAPFSGLMNLLTICPFCLKPVITTAYSSPSMVTLSGDTLVGRSTSSSGVGPSLGVSKWWKRKPKSRSVSSSSNRMRTARSTSNRLSAPPWMGKFWWVKVPSVNSEPSAFTSIVPPANT